MGSNPPAPAQTKAYEGTGKMPKTKKHVGAKYTKQGNYLLRSTRSHELIKFALLIESGRVVLRNGNWVIIRANGTWAGNCPWSALMFLNRSLAMITKGTFQLTDAGREALDGALEISPSIKFSVSRVLREIDSKKID